MSGYTHQWRRAPALESRAFAQAVEDVRLILDRVTKMGLKIAGPTGYGAPEITANTIAFNGSATCGHRYADYGDPWPTEDASGVYGIATEIEVPPDSVLLPSADTETIPEPYAPEPYWSGAYLTTRACHGETHCAGAAFVIDRVQLVRPWMRLEDGGYFCRCATLFKPYDLPVTAALIRLKEHFKNEIRINSDGRLPAFEDAKRLCRDLFGWPRYFELESVDSASV